MSSITKIIAKVFFILVGVVIAANIIIVPNRKGIINDPNKIPNREIALIFGGGMEEDGSMTHMQTDRVIRGVELYKSGKVKKLMMTGDDGGNHADEVGAMKSYAIQAGIPAIDILTDPHGYRTYESCYRERSVYGLTSTLAVSQSFHLPRIIYLCKGFGIDTVGVAADLRDYGWRQHFMEIREVFARLKAVVQKDITRPKPISLEK